MLELIEKKDLLQWWYTNKETIIQESFNGRFDYWVDTISNKLECDKYIVKNYISSFYN